MKLAKAVPGLKGYEVTRGPIMSLSGPAPYYLIAVLTFDSMESIALALASPQGQAVAADLDNFAIGRRGNPDGRIRDGLNLPPATHSCLSPIPISSRRTSRRRSARKFARCRPTRSRKQRE